MFDHMFPDLPVPDLGSTSITNTTVPLTLELDWANAVNKGSGNAQYQTWQWQFPRPIKGYNWAELYSMDWQATTYSSQPVLICPRIEEFGSGMVQTTHNLTVVPTWIVPNYSSTTPPQFHHRGTRFLAVTKLSSDQAFTTLTFSFANETGALVPVVSIPPGPHYCHVVLKFYQ